MNPFDFFRHQYQLGQLLAVPLMEAWQNIINQFTERCSTPVMACCRSGGEGGQFAFKLLEIQSFTLGRALQRLFSATAEIQIVQAEQA
ncbi:hypothetical protein D3C72_1420200 [compost metagenome]